MPKLYKTVQLLGVPHYFQGTHDSLCTYYSAAMLLASLYPEFQDFFGIGARRQKVGLKVYDPIMRFFPHAPKETKDRMLATWFYRGASLKNAMKALNSSMKANNLDTRFKYEQYKNLNSTFDIITNNIDRGLPMMAGWTTVDFGVHCVLVIGYKKESQNWLILNDTSGGKEVCWEVLKRINKSRLEIVSVDKHEGPRPDRLTTFNSKRFKPTQLDRWWPYENDICYQSIKDLYDVARHNLSFASEESP